MASVTASTFVGGLVGIDQVSSTVNDSYSTGIVSGSIAVGGLAGSNSTSSVSNSFWDTGTSGQSSSAGGTGESDAAMKTESTFTNAGWDFTGTWAMSSGINGGYPYLQVLGADISLPVQATGFAATASMNSVTISWRTQSEVDNAGFTIMRMKQGTVGTGRGRWQVIASYTTDDSLRGLGTSSRGKSYNFTDYEVTSGESYTYKIKEVSTNGTTKELSTLSVTVDVPNAYALYQNYPNPFNPSTTIRFDLKETSKVTLAIYSVLGQEVEHWNYRAMNAGRYNKEVNMAAFASGVYFYRIAAKGNNGERFVAIKKLMLVK